MQALDRTCLLDYIRQAFDRKKVLIVYTEIKMDKGRRYNMYTSYNDYHSPCSNAVKVDPNDRISLGELVGIYCNEKCSWSYNNYPPNYYAKVVPNDKIPLVELISIYHDNCSRNYNDTDYENDIDMNELMHFIIDNVIYHFNLNGKISILSHREIFTGSNAIVLDDENDINKQVVHKEKHKKKKSIHEHWIFTNDTILHMLLFECFPKSLIIEDYIDIISMIVLFGRVNSFWYKQSIEIKERIIPYLRTLVPSHGIETFRVSPDVDKHYIFMPVKIITYQYEEGVVKTNRLFCKKNTMRYVGKCINYESIGCCQNDAEEIFTFEKDGEIIIMRQYYNDNKICFNHVEECNIGKDPCEILCRYDNKKQSDEFFDMKQTEHECCTYVFEYMYNIYFDKNVDEQENVKKKASEYVKKLWRWRKSYIHRLQ